MIYLDYAASGVPFEEAMTLMYQVSLKHYANPGAIHSPGGEARRILQESRRKLAALLKVQDREVFFTSGGTEANNWAVKLGCRQKNGRTILVFSAEHKSVLASAFAMEKQGYRVKLLNPDNRGKLQPQTLEAAVTSDTALVCVQAVNNETGVIQDIAALSQITRKHRIPMLCDAVQSFGHVLQPLHCADFITISAHKFGGPRGVGCLIARHPYFPEPLMHGGGQELGLRSGTENLPAIAAMTRAAELSVSNISQETQHLRALTALLIKYLQEIDSRIEVNAHAEDTHPGIVNCYFPGISGEEMAAWLDLKGICVSPGAACSARDSRPSHVLLAMGYSEKRAQESIRFSLGRNITQKDILLTVAAIEEILRSKRKDV